MAALNFLSWVTYNNVEEPTTGPFSYSSILLFRHGLVPHEAQLVVYKNGRLLEPSEYTLFPATYELTTSEPIVPGDVLKIQRRTKKDSRYVDYTNSNVDEATMDQDSNQLFFLIQEALDNAAANLGLGPNGHWDAQGLQIQNGAPTDDPNGFVTLAQALDLFGGTLTTFVDNSLTLCWDGDGVTDTYRLESAPIGTYNAGSLFVTVANVPQSPCAIEPEEPTYQVFNIQDEGHPHHEEWLALQQEGIAPEAEDYHEDPVLVFSTPPAPRARIVARLILGTVQSLPQTDSIQSQHIAQGAIQLRHLASQPGERTRYIRFSPDGTPSVGRIVADDVDSLNDRVRTENAFTDLGASGNYSLANRHVDMQSFAIVGLRHPTSPYEAARKAYVDQTVASVPTPVCGTIGAIGASWTQWFTLPFTPKAVMIQANSDGGRSGVFVFQSLAVASVIRTTTMVTPGGSGRRYSIERQGNRIRFRTEPTHDDVLTTWNYCAIP